MVDETLLALIHQTPAREHWEKIGIRDRHGICVPLFYLRTENSHGIGEFADLYPVIDWCASVGFDIIQLLPLNDSANPSPYNGLSAVALNPLHLSLQQLKGFKETEETKLLKKIDTEKRINFPQLRLNKEHFLKLYFASHREEFVNDPAFHEFVEKHPWTRTYALFKVLKEISGGSHWQDWDIKYRCRNLDALLQIAEEEREMIHYFEYLQFLCYTQMKEVREYANEKGILIKGDLPILLSPDSADVWAHTELFNQNLAAGAPPDMYSPKGQYWGFPLYRWEALKARDYTFWKKRLRASEDLYNLYRLDHVVGFFRIWAIERGKGPEEGFFTPPEENLWLEQGHQLMSVLLQTTGMLPVGEDLGTVPDEVRAVLTQMGIPGTKVMRWEKNWLGDQNLINPKLYPPLSMTTVSTHDSETLGQWWAHEPDEAKRLAKVKGWDYDEKITYDQRFEILRDTHTSSSIFHINLLSEYLSLYPELIHDDPNEERINVPGTLSPTNWTIRQKVPFHEIMEHSQLQEAIEKLLKS